MAIRRVPTTVAILVGGLISAACSMPGYAAASSAGASAPRPASHAKRAPIKYLGVVEKNVPESYSLVNEFARTVKRKPNIVAYYSGWSEPFKAKFAKTAYQHGARVLVDIDPDNTSVAGIAAGKDDGFLNRYAAAVKAFGHGVIINFGHEPNGAWFSWGNTHTPARTYIAAWRHIVTLFRADGTKNVTWMWIVNRMGGTEGPIRDWWPGSKYVNWVGIDGYFEEKAETFSSIIVPTIKAIRKLTRAPILMSETSIGQLAGQVAKMPGLFAGIRSRHLLGLVWFDTNQRGGFHHQDWRLEGHPAAIRAFRRGLRT